MILGIQKKLFGLLGRALPFFSGDILNRPCFITGVGRSGTTLLEGILRYHPQLAVFPGEANDLWHPHSYPWTKYASTLKKEVNPFWIDPKGFSQYTLQKYTNKDLHRLHNTFSWFAAFYRNRAFVNKSAMITYLIPFILEQYPKARFISMVRDGRAVALSYAKKQAEKLERSPDAFPWVTEDQNFQDLLIVLSRLWQEHLDFLQLLQDEGTLNQDNFLSIRYEDLCSQPKKTLSDIFKFLVVAPENFPLRTYDFIKSTNSKFELELQESIQELMSTEMRKGLQKFKYL